MVLKVLTMMLMMGHAFSKLLLPIPFNFYFWPYESS